MLGYDTYSRQVFGPLLIACTCDGQNHVSLMAFAVVDPTTNLVLASVKLQDRIIFFLCYLGEGGKAHHYNIR